jgi:AraC-like DNA-binding protein
MNDVFEMEYRAPRLMNKHHRHHQFEVNYLLKGSVSYLYTGQLLKLKEKSFNLMWAGLPHQLIEMSEDTMMIWIILPMDLFLNSGYSSAFVGKLLQGEIFQNQLDTDQLQLTRWYNEYLIKPDSREILLKEIECRIRRLEESNQAIKPAKNFFPKKSLEKISVVCRYISENFDKEIKIEELASQVKLHPNYLMNLFKNETGYSINYYVTRLRVAKAQTLLVTTNEKITNILYQCGFQSPSRFYEAFHEITGLTPRDFKIKNSKN